MWRRLSDGGAQAQPYGYRRQGRRPAAQAEACGQGGIHAAVPAVVYAAICVAIRRLEGPETTDRPRSVMEYREV